MINKLNFYYHIPFCKKKCAYCAFFSLSGRNDELKKEYFDALIRQTKMFETDRTVSNIYIGGGTPPVLGIKRLCKLIGVIKNRFDVSENAEITVEVNPGAIDLDELKALKDAGFNRVSIGVQSLDNNVLKGIGRIHTKEEALMCIEDAEKAGFQNISADLIFALPFRRRGEFKKEVLRIMSTGITHLSAYSLQLEEGTLLYKNRENLVFPNEDEEEEEYADLCAAARENGFLHYEISSFAKENFESRHNTGYWTGDEYFGFGAGAHSYYLGKRFSSPQDIRYFINHTLESAFEPTDFETSDFLSEEEREEERIMLGLRTMRGVALDKKGLSKAKKIAELGYGTVSGNRFSLNEKGYRVSNEIIAQILV